jgi:UDP-N-acetylmuramyl pentapeptide synthase
VFVRGGQIVAAEGATERVIAPLPKGEPHVTNVLAAVGAAVAFGLADNVIAERLS